MMMDILVETWDLKCMDCPTHVIHKTNKNYFTVTLQGGQLLTTCFTIP